VHPARVAARFPEQPELQAVAWLHDVLEDSATTPADLEHEGIPARVIAAVMAISRRSQEDYAAFIQRVKANDLAREIKIADMLDNLADHPTLKQIRKYAHALLELVEDET
jgi:hypothetical protein